MKGLQPMIRNLLVLVLLGTAGAQAQVRPGLLLQPEPPRVANAVQGREPQNGVAQPAGAEQAALTPLRVQVTLSKYENGSNAARRIGSVPYELAVTANDPRPVHLRMGSQVPVPAGPDGAFTYLNVGTTIDVIASSTGDGRFKIELTIEESSIVDRRSPEAQSTSVPTLKSFHVTNSPVLRDGQSTQFTAATDKSSGEVTKVEVSLAVEK